MVKYSMVIPSPFTINILVELDIADSAFVAPDVISPKLIELPEVDNCNDSIFLNEVAGDIISYPPAIIARPRLEGLF